MKNFFKHLLILFLPFFLVKIIYAQKINVAFDTLNWDLSKAKLTDHLGRNAIIGTAFLKNVVFENGVIEIDIATTDRSRSYPGVAFHAMDALNYERFYIRPHRSPYYDDALQYAATYNGMDSWQLYYGEGKTAGLEIFPEKWNHLKIVITGEAAVVYWNDTTNPALIVPKLSYGSISGSIGLIGPMDGTAYFSNFSYEKKSNSKNFQIIEKSDMPGIIAHWELSSPFSLQFADFTKYNPNPEILAKSWQKISSDKQGVVDISKYFPRKHRAGDGILAKTNIKVDKDTLLRLGFGYSDYIIVFLNKQAVFFGNSAYQSRDKSFSGFVGYNDVLFLPCKKGDNELMVQVGESMGGWGFCFRKEDEIFVHPALKKEWSLKNKLAMPEAIVYDSINDVLYVSNYFNEGNEFLSKIATDGKIIEKEWIKGLRLPTGMCQNGNILYAVDRSGLNKIDIQKNEVIEKISLKDMRSPNDITMDKNDIFYISDFPTNTVFCYADGKLALWHDNLNNPNALKVCNDELLIGQNESILKINLVSKEINTFALFEQGTNIDGIEPIGNGDYLVTDFFGRLYHVTKNGKTTLLLNTTTYGLQLADFCYIPGKHLIVLPAYNDNSILCFSIDLEKIKN